MVFWRFRVRDYVTQRLVKRQYGIDYRSRRGNGCYNKVNGSLPSHAIDHNYRGMCEIFEKVV